MIQVRDCRAAKQLCWKAPGVLVDDELNMNQQCALATESWAEVTSLVDQRSNYTYLFSTFLTTKYYTQFWALSIGKYIN